MGSATLKTFKSRARKHCPRSTPLTLRRRRSTAGPLCRVGLVTRGIRKGSRNKLTETFVTAVAHDLAEHGAEVLEKLRKTDLEAHLKIVGRLVLRELVLERERDPNFADMTEDEVVELLDRARRNDLVRSYLRQIAKPGEPSLP